MTNNTMTPAMQAIIRTYAKCWVCRKDGRRAEMVYTANLGNGQNICHPECLSGNGR